jgi:two-component system response regulator PilR (NtrC family)
MVNPELGCRRVIRDSRRRIHNSPLAIHNSEALWLACLSWTTRNHSASCWKSPFGHIVEIASSGASALNKINSQVYDVIVSDIRMPDITGIDLLEKARNMGIATPFVLITAVPTVSTAIQALNLGADRYVIKTDKLVEELKVVVQRELESLRLREENIQLRRELLRVFARKNILGQSRKIQDILEMVRTVAGTTSTVLIAGESGTGKELVARAVHEASPRREKPFISINCGAFPETLLESELFGYFRGAFTGAYADKKGIFEAASGGTLFLDEIGETTPAMQVKLLRVLQERKVRPLGGTVDVPVDVRLIASTNRDLKGMINAGQFREDFFYRVSVIPIHVPSLRERPEDIEPLARHFLRTFCVRMGKAIRDIDESAVKAMRRYSWPGNVRELENAMERAVALAGENDNVISASHLPEPIREAVAITVEGGPPKIELPQQGIDFEAHLAQIEKQYLAEALRAAGGVRTRAAELLHISYRSFRHYAKKYGL